MPRDEVLALDPELSKMWFEARERHLGHLSAYSFDLQGTPPGVTTGKACAYETICSSREMVKKRESKRAWIRKDRAEM